MTLLSHRTVLDFSDLLFDLVANSGFELSHFLLCRSKKSINEQTDDSSIFYEIE